MPFTIIATSFGPIGPNTEGCVRLKNAMVGTPAALARCIGPVSALKNPLTCEIVAASIRGEGQWTVAKSLLTGGWLALGSTSSLHYS